MATIGMHPPTGAAADAMGSLGALPGARFTEGMVFGLDGAEPVGPEAAGCVMVLLGMLADDALAQQFYVQAAAVTRAAREAPGFLRFLVVQDGAALYGIGFWRTVEDAEAFARSSGHREAMADLARTGSQYNHFAGLWTVHQPRKRHIFCDRCQARNDVPAEHCGRCGNPLVDGFRDQWGRARANGA
jgi:heme-degrading monooxygenase HmoA/ribosomal protein L37E